MHLSEGVPIHITVPDCKPHHRDSLHSFSQAQVYIAHITGIEILMDFSKRRTEI